MRKKRICRFLSMFLVLDLIVGLLNFAPSSLLVVSANSVGSVESNSQSIQGLDYRLPYPRGASYQVSRAGTGHENKYDFEMPVGSDVVAVIGGSIRERETRDSSDCKCTSNTDCNNRGCKNNQVVIDQDDGTTGYYLHVNKGSILIRSGRVEQGDFIAESGDQGLSFGPHLDYRRYQGVTVVPTPFMEAPNLNVNWNDSNKPKPVSQNIREDSSSIILYPKPDFKIGDAGSVTRWVEIKPPYTGDLTQLGDFKPISVRFPHYVQYECMYCQDWTLTKVIRSANGHNLALDVESRQILDNNAPVIQYPWWGGGNQLWIFTHLPDEGVNVFRIRSLDSGKCLEVEGNSLDNNAKIVQDVCNNEVDEKWQVNEINIGSLGIDRVYSIKNLNSKKVLDVPGGTTNPLTQIIQYANHEGFNQLWYIYSYGELKLSLKDSTGRVFHLNNDDKNLTENLNGYSSEVMGVSYRAYRGAENIMMMPTGESFDIKAFSPNRSPWRPDIQRPINGTNYIYRTPDLCWQPRGDPDGNDSFYTVEVLKDSNIVQSSGWIKNNCWKPSLDYQYGVYWWRVKSRDTHFSESEWSAYTSFSISTPNLPPTVVLNTANASSDAVIYATDTSWTFNGTASDPEGQLNRVEYGCVGDSCGTTASHTNGANWSHSQNGLLGLNEIYFVAYDNAGNSSASRRVTLNVDLASPATTPGLNGESNPGNWPVWFTGSVYVSLNSVDGSTGRARSGINRLMVRLDGGDWQTVSNTSTSFTVNSDGAHTVEYYAVDNVGNAEAARSVSFQIDQTPPGYPSKVVESNGVQNDQWQKDSNLPVFTWDAAVDALSGLWGYQVYFGEDPSGIGLVNIAANAPREWTPQPDGVHTGTYYLRGRTRDNAGNWSAWTTWFTYRYDGTPPENPTQITHAAGITNTLWQNLSNTADFVWPVPHDEGSGIQGYYVAWGTNPNATSDTLLTDNAYLNLTPLCGATQACIGYLRLRSVDKVGNLAGDWSTVFELRYDNAPPTLDFSLNNGATQTSQTQIVINLDAADEGSGVRSMRISSDNANWTEWEAYATNRGWTIPAISRQDWPVYVQVQDWVALKSAVETRSIYLDVNPPRPESANFRLFDTDLNSGAGAFTSQVYSGRGTLGQTLDSDVITSANFQLSLGYEVGSQAIPLLQPGHDDFDHINGVFAAGSRAAGMSSSSYNMTGAFGELGLPNQASIYSNHYQHQPGFLAAQPSVQTQTAEPPPGIEPEPDPVITCESPMVAINQNTGFTNNLNTMLTICSPQAAEMMISNDPAFAGASWEPYAVSKPWLLPDEGAQVAPRFVYVLFKDTSGGVQGAFFDDILYDPNLPNSEVLFSDDIPEAGTMRIVRVDMTPKDLPTEEKRDGVVIYRDLPVLPAQPDGSVNLYIKGFDDNSGIAEVQLSEDPTFADAEWRPFALLQSWMPSSPDDGPKTVYVRLRDNAGNLAAVNRIDFVLDANSPYGWVGFEQHTYSIQTAAVTVYLGAFDGIMADDVEFPPADVYEGIVQDMRISFDPLFTDAVWQPYAETYELPASVDHPEFKTVYVQYRDYVGNVSEVYSDSYEFDDFSPIVQASVSSGETLQRTVSIYAIDDRSELAELRITNDPLMADENTSTLPYVDTIEWTFTEDRIAWIQVSDSIGNWSDPYPVYAPAFAPPDCSVQETPYFTEAFGSVLITDTDAPVGTVIQALNPRGDTVGCFTVSEAGNYGLMRIYGEDATASPAIPGMRPDEMVTFKVNGAQAVANPVLYWSDDHASHTIDLNAGNIDGQMLLLQPGWNLMSFNVEPPAPQIPSILQSIDGQYDRVLGEYGIFVPDLADAFNSLREMHSSTGYYLRVTESASISLVVEGIPQCNSPIELHAGWNWIGGPCAVSPVETALESIAGHYQRILSLDKTYDPALPEYSTLAEMQPGEGYLIHMNDPVTLIYPAGTLQAGGQESIEDMACGVVSSTPLATLVYGELRWMGQPLPAGSKLEVVTPRGEIAGCGVIRENGMLPLTMIYGSDSEDVPGFLEGEPMNIRINGMDHSLPLDFSWTDDKTPHWINPEIVGQKIYLPAIYK